MLCAGKAILHAQLKLWLQVRAQGLLHRLVHPPEARHVPAVRSTTAHLERNPNSGRTIFSCVLEDAQKCVRNPYGARRDPCDPSKSIDKS